MPSRGFSELVLVARNRANLDAEAEAVKASGAEPLVIDADLADPAHTTHAQWKAGVALTLRGMSSQDCCLDGIKVAKRSVVLMSGNSAFFSKAPYAGVGTINAVICRRQTFRRRPVPVDVASPRT